MILANSLSGLAQDDTNGIDLSDTTNIEERIESFVNNKLKSQRIDLLVNESFCFNFKFISIF